MEVTSFLNIPGWDVFIISLMLMVVATVPYFEICYFINVLTSGSLHCSCLLPATGICR
jgi:hypothetical protein